MSDLIGTRMSDDGRTARQIFDDVMANPARARFGFGKKLAIINVDFQNAYTRIDRYKTAYETDPRQIEYTNTISALARDVGMPDMPTTPAMPAPGAPAPIRPIACRTSNMAATAMPMMRVATFAPATRNTPSACRRHFSKHRCNRFWSGIRSIRWW